MAAGSWTAARGGAIDDLPGCHANPRDHGSWPPPRRGGDPLCLTPDHFHETARRSCSPTAWSRLAPPIARVKLTSGGSEANEAALRARSQLPRRAWRRRPLAGDLAGSGLPRGDDGSPGAERPANSAAPARRLPGAPPSFAAEQLALRPDRPGRSRRSRPGPRRGGSGDRRRGSSASPSVALRCPAMSRRTGSGKAWRNVANGADSSSASTRSSAGSAGPAAGSPASTPRFEPEHRSDYLGRSLGAGHAPPPATLRSARVYEAIAAGSRRVRPRISTSWTARPLAGAPASGSRRSTRSTREA